MFKGIKRISAMVMSCVMAVGLMGAGQSEGGLAVAAKAYDLEPAGVYRKYEAPQRDWAPLTGCEKVLASNQEAHFADVQVGNWYARSGKLKNSVRFCVSGQDSYRNTHYIIYNLKGNYTQMTGLNKGSVNENVDGCQKLFLVVRAVQQFLKGVTGVGGNLIALFFQQLGKLGKACGLGEGFAAGEGHTPAQGIGFYHIHQVFYRYHSTAAKIPGFRVMAAGAMVGTTLAEEGGADAGAVHDAVLNDAA